MKARMFTRRDFLKASGAGLISLTTGRAHFQPQIGPNSRVHLHTFDPAATSSTEAVRGAMLAATDLSWLRAGES
ncbi:MAG: twin-arginine translocation signal domain-containing protein, partial [Anaerolineae bacterium]|nr:twin-arginine translocation signal domain-containing protein [Anaerolineae bacterium]